MMSITAYVCLYSVAQPCTRLCVPVCVCVQDVERNEDAWPFKVPVSREEVPDYYEIIKVRHVCASVYAIVSVREELLILHQTQGCFMDICFSVSKQDVTGNVSSRASFAAQHIYFAHSSTQTEVFPGSSVCYNKLLGLTRTVYIHRIFGDFQAKNTVCTPYIYGSGQPYKLL